MSDEALAKVRAHFANFRDPGKLVEIKVPEWDLSVYYWPHLSLGERRAINIAAQAGTKVSEDDASVKIDRHGREVMELIVRARDEHGRALFHESQLHMLLEHGDPEIIERIVAQMTDQFMTPEAAEKN